MTQNLNHNHNSILIFPIIFKYEFEFIKYLTLYEKKEMNVAKVVVFF